MIIFLISRIPSQVSHVTFGDRSSHVLYTIQVPDIALGRNRGTGVDTSIDHR